MPKFDMETMNELRDLEAVAIRTEQHPDVAVPIWVAVAADQVFVRSTRGTADRWYRDVVASGGATLEFADRQVPIRVMPALDQTSVERANRGYRIKYPVSSYFRSVMKSDSLPTTLRLEPAGQQATF
jgi:hypothetical protein